MDKFLTFEQPLNEKMRAFLRVEHLIKHAKHALNQETLWDTRSGINAFLDIIELMERIDLRHETSKELERLQTLFQQWQTNASVDPERIEAVLEQLDQQSQTIQSMPSKLDNTLRQHTFLNQIRRRTTIPGGCCSFDIPAYHFWLHKPFESRQQDIHEFLVTINPLCDAIHFILSIVRQSAQPTSETASNGYYQKHFHSTVTPQLVQVHIAQSLPYYPEISGSKHCINLRFLAQPEALSKPANQAEDDVQFYLSCCGL